VVELAAVIARQMSSNSDIEAYKVQSGSGSTQIA
jgi:hypothetical protein